MNIKQLILFLSILCNSIWTAAQLRDSKIIFSTGLHSYNYIQIDSIGISPVYLNDDPSKADFLFNNESSVFGLFKVGGRFGEGEFFDFEPETGIYKKVFDIGPTTIFSKSEHPSGMIKDDQGNYWATALEEAYNGYFLKIDSAHNFSREFNFDRNLTGTAPNSNLILKNGYVYGATGNGWIGSSPDCGPGSDYGRGCLYRFNTNNGDVDVLTCFKGCQVYYEYVKYNLLEKDDRIFIFSNQWNGIYGSYAPNTFEYNIDLDSLVEIPTSLKAATILKNKIYGLNSLYDSILISIDLSMDYKIDSIHLFEGYQEVFNYNEDLIFSNQHSVSRYNISSRSTEVLIQPTKGQRISDVTIKGDYLILSIKNCSTESKWSCVSESLMTLNLASKKRKEHLYSNIYSYSRDIFSIYQDYNVLGSSKLYNHELSLFEINPINGEKSELLSFVDSVEKYNKSKFVKYDNRIWFSSFQGGDYGYGGILEFDYNSNSLNYVYSFDSIFRFQYGSINLLKTESEIIFGHGNKLFRYDINNSSILEIPVYDTLNSLNVRIDELSCFNGKLYWYNNQKLFSYNLRQNTFQHKELPAETGIKRNDRLRSISNFLYRNNRIWVGIWYYNAWGWRNWYGILSFTENLSDIRFYTCPSEFGTQSKSRIALSENQIIGSVYSGESAFNYVTSKLYSFNLDSLKYDMLIEIPPEITSSPVNDVLVIPIEDLKKMKEESVILYPNPSNDYLMILGKADSKILGYEIFNSKGILIQRKSELLSSQGIDISSLPYGMYILRLTFEDETISKRFVKTY